MLWLPSLNVDEVIDQAPVPSACTLPTGVAPSNRVTYEFASTEPANPKNVGVVLLVTSSVDDTPESLPASKFGVDGVAGAVVSIVTASEADELLTLPAASVAFTVMLWLPSLNVDEVIDQAPVPSACTLPTGVAPSNRVTYAFASTEPAQTH